MVLIKSSNLRVSEKRHEEESEKIYPVFYENSIVLLKLMTAHLDKLENEI
jgi:hypothetical protein